jgi:hypothetical protein
MKIRGIPTSLLGAALLAGVVSTSWAAQPPGPPPPRSAREAAQSDLTGNWVAQVTEDWRWRMLTAPIGDAEGVPLNPAGREFSSRWNLEADNAKGDQCKAYGAAAIMRMPTRVRVSWADDNTLKFEMDAGTQTRLLKFGAANTAAAERTLQGTSVAEWMRPPPAFQGNSLNQQAGLPGRAPVAQGAPPPAPVATVARGSLKVQTTNLKAGYLRKNGIPYSDNVVMTEYYDRVNFFGVDYLQVTTVVVDPTYLTVPFIVSNQFKREPDGSKWNPTPCRTDPPGNTNRPKGDFGIQGDRSR